ncbi:MAG: threonine ammonia-lyase [Thermoplasmatota archaeon]
MIHFTDIEEAKTIVSDVVKKTYLKKSKTFSEMTDANLYLKMENLQLTGSFKIRGAYNKIYHLNEKDKHKGVVCSSAGNHAQGVAHAATLLQVESTVFMPIFAPPTKILATKSYGAHVILKGETYDDAYENACEYGKKHHLCFVHPFNDEKVIAGQGTIGIEIYDDLQDIDVILVPIGGGGLISGISIALKHLKPDIQIIGVEAEGAKAMMQSVEAGKIKPVHNMATIADGIAVKNPGEKTFEIIQKHVDDIITVSDKEIAQAMYHLLQRAKIVVEPAGAVTLAAAIANKQRFKGKNIVTLISGGNVNLSLLTQVIEQGMLSNNLMGKMTITVQDTPKIFKDIISVLSKRNVNIQEIFLDRSSTNVPVGSVNVHLSFLITGKEQITQIYNELQSMNLSCEICC